jgi:hypothetical protein
MFDRRQAKTPQEERAINVLISAARRRDSTAEIARTIRTVLSSAGIEADVRAPEEVRSVTAYQGVMAAPQRSTSTALERGIATDHARDRVARALYEVLVDSVDFGPCDLPTAEDREWIRGAIAAPISEATEVALEELAARLAAALERAPNGLMARFDASHRWDELGWE